MLFPTKVNLLDQVNLEFQYVPRLADYRRLKVTPEYVVPFDIFQLVGCTTQYIAYENCNYLQVFQYIRSR